MFRSFKFFQGATVDIDDFCRSLTALGYKRQEKVQEEGDFARRGGIVDVFPATFEHPLRVVWDNDVVRSIKSFSLLTHELFWDHTIVIILPKKTEMHHRSAGMISSEVPLATFVDIQKNDLVVHQQYGIGIFAGMEK